MIRLKQKFVLNANSTVLKFTNIPFVFTAFLPNGGKLFLQAGNDKVSVVGSNKTLFRINYFDDLKAIVPVDETSTVLVNAYGRRVSASRLLFTLNSS